MMATGAGRAALIGAAVAIVVVVMGAVGLLVWASSATQEPVERYLVIVTAPGADGSDIAVLAIDMRSAGEAVVLDVLADADVPGTSARTAQEAYPFGGGDAVARALGAQTGGEPLSWVVVPAQTLSQLIDEHGGIEVDVPTGLSAYTDGSLELFEPGIRKLDGGGTSALLSAAGFLEEPAARLAVQQDVGLKVAALLNGRDGLLRDLVGSGRARSSVPADRLPR